MHDPRLEGEGGQGITSCRIRWDLDSLGLPSEAHGLGRGGQQPLEPSLSLCLLEISGKLVSSNYRRLNGGPSPGWLQDTRRWQDLG